MSYIYRLLNSVDVAVFKQGMHK